MRLFSFPSRCLIRQAIPRVALTGFVLLLAAATLVRAAETAKNRDDESAASKDQPPGSSTARDAEPADDFGQPGPPRRNGQRQPGPPRRDGQMGGPNERQPGPPDGPDGRPDDPDGPPPGAGGPPFGQGGSPPGRNGPPNRPDSFGPGQPRGPRPDWPSMERNDPEMIKLIKAENELDRRTHELAREYRDASGDQRAKLKQDLNKAVAEQFATRQKRRKLELTRFEEELKRLREATDQREKNKQQIIEKRVSDLLGEEAETGF